MMDEKIQRIINNEIKTRADRIRLIKKAFTLPGEDASTYSVAQLNIIAGKNSTIERIPKDALDIETTHARLVCFLKSGFLWHKLNTYMLANGYKSLDFNPEILPDMDFLTRCIAYYDKNNTMGLLKEKPSYKIVNEFLNNFSINIQA